MALSSEQRGVLSEILRIGAKRGVSPLVLKSAVETGLVESGLRNLNYGDADSRGWRQERASLYRNPTNLRASINRYFDEATGFYKTGRYSNAGALAADVQRPAAQYRGRYGEVAGQAAQLIDRFGNRVNAPARGNNNRGGGRGPVVIPGRPPQAAGLGGLNVAAPDMAGLSQLLSGGHQEERQQATPIASPEFSASRYLPAGGLSIQSMQPQQFDDGLAGKLAAIGMPQGVLTGRAAKGEPGTMSKVVGGEAGRQADGLGWRPRKEPGGRAGAAKAAAWARSVLGESESSGSNRSPFIDQLQRPFGMVGQAWCAMFTSKAVQMGGLPKSSATPRVADVRAWAHAKNNGYKGFVPATKAKTGDLILWGNDHIGMVVKNSGRDLVIVAGNDSQKVNRRRVGYGDGDIVRPDYRR